MVQVAGLPQGLELRMEDAQMNAAMALLSSFKNFGKVRYATPIGPRHLPEETLEDMKNYKAHNTRFDPTKAYPSPHKDISDDFFQKTLLQCAKDLQEVEEIKGIYAGYFQMDETGKYNVKPGGYTGCYGSAMTTNHGGRNVLHYGEIFSGWDNPAHSKYFEYLVDEKYSPLRTLIPPGLINTIYAKGKDGEERIKGYIVTDTSTANAAAIANIGLMHRMMHSGQQGPLWNMLLDNGFDRIESFILMHLVGLGLARNGYDNQPKSHGIIHTRPYHTSLNVGHTPFMMSRVLTKSPVLRKGDNHARTIWQARGFNPCNSIWDDEAVGKMYYSSRPPLANSYPIQQQRDWNFCITIPKLVQEIAPNKTPSAAERNDWSYTPQPVARSPEETAELNARILTVLKTEIRKWRKEVTNDTAIAA
jgi:hypothetical protein